MTVVDTAWIHAEIAAGVSVDQLHLTVQPIVDLDDGRVIGGESFVRWLHPERGYVRPDVWIPVAAEHGALTGCLLAILDRWLRAADAGPTVSINIDPSQLTDDRFGEALAAVSTERRARLAVELHHRDLRLVGADAAMSVELQRLRRLGVELWLDDLDGRAQLDLAEARPAFADLVKLDRSLHSWSDDSLAELMTAIGDRPTGAEGVESQGQADRCRAPGLGAGQGFLFGRELPLDRWLELAS